MDLNDRLVADFWYDKFKQLQADFDHAEQELRELKARFAKEIAEDKLSKSLAALGD